jgi:hypothetical protein
MAKVDTSGRPGSVFATVITANSHCASLCLYRACWLQLFLFASVLFFWWNFTHEVVFWEHIDISLYWQSKVLVATALCLSHGNGTAKELGKMCLTTRLKGVLKLYNLDRVSCVRLLIVGGAFWNNLFRELFRFVLKRWLNVNKVPHFWGRDAFQSSG